MGDVIDQHLLLGTLRVQPSNQRSLGIYGACTSRRSRCGTWTVVCHVKLYELVTYVLVLHLMFPLFKFEFG
ncbi:hypothetical protein HanPSC8_Chr14g0595821 [Helianthus annuus]|nr:hypothetical protein HanPSC8_Chr14g0595821 [Helianthus annuus]